MGNIDLICMLGIYKLELDLVEEGDRISQNYMAIKSWLYAKRYSDLHKQIYFN